MKTIKTLLIISLLFPVAAFADGDVFEQLSETDWFNQPNTETIVVFQPQEPTPLDSALKEKALNGEYESDTSRVIRQGMAYHLDLPLGYDYKRNK